MHETVFVGSFRVYQSSKQPAIAILGRSNVGKSSFINAITESKIARCAKKPGATKLLNYYACNHNNALQLYLIDTPGYGYHSTSKKGIAEIGEQIVNLLSSDQTKRAILLVDSRRTFDQNDNELINLLIKNQLKVLLVFTKCDKLGQSETFQLKLRIKEAEK